MVQAEHELLRELGEPSALPSARLGGVEVKLARGVIGVLTEGGGSGGRKGQARERVARREATTRGTTFDSREARGPWDETGRGAGGRVHRGARKKTRTRARSRRARRVAHLARGVRHGEAELGARAGAIHRAPETEERGSGSAVARASEKMSRADDGETGAADGDDRVTLGVRTLRSRRRECEELAGASARAKWTPGRSARGRRIQNRTRTAERSKTRSLFVIRQPARDVHG